MAHTNWYRYGTVTITNGSDHVLGLNGTHWADIGIGKGDIFTLDGEKIYEIDAVTDNANLTLKTPFEGATVAEVHYCIIRNFTDISTADIVAQMSELRVEMKTYIDTEMQTLTGKSAFQIAQDEGFTGTESEWLDSLTGYGIAQENGFTGTKAQWLESLKAAGEWTSANTRITTLETENNKIPRYIKALPRSGKQELYFHNFFPRFAQWRYTSREAREAQYTALAAEDISDFYAGDKWEFMARSAAGGDENIPSDLTFIVLIAQVNPNKTLDCIVQFYHGNYYKMNDTATTEGGYMGSKFYTETLPVITGWLEEVFGEHLKAHKEYINNSNVVNAQGRSGRTTLTDRKADLLRLEQIVRHPYFNYDIGYDAGFVTPFPVFEHMPYLIADLWQVTNPITFLQDVSPLNPTSRFLVYNPQYRQLSELNANFAWCTPLLHIVLG